SRPLLRARVRKVFHPRDAQSDKLRSAGHREQTYNSCQHCHRPSRPQVDKPCSPGPRRKFFPRRGHSPDRSKFLEPQVAFVRLMSCCCSFDLPLRTSPDVLPRTIEWAEDSAYYSTPRFLRTSVGDQD